MNEKMTLFSYDQTPFIVPQNGSKVALRIEAENDLIAVSRDDTRHQVYSWSDLHSCKRSGAGQQGLLLCPNANVYYREDDANCLVGLFKRKMDVVRNECRWKSATKSAYAIQVNANQV